MVMLEIYPPNIKVPGRNGTEGPDPKHSINDRRK